MIEILELSYRKPQNPAPEVPFLMVNIVFKLAGVEEGAPEWKVLEREALFRRLVGESEDVRQELVSEYEADLWRGEFVKMWTFQEPILLHLKKFDVFWFRQYVADCPVTRAALRDLRYYQQNKSFSSVYRHLDDCTFLRLLKTLDLFWD